MRCFLALALFFTSEIFPLALFFTNDVFAMALFFARVGGFSGGVVYCERAFCGVIFFQRIFLFSYGHQGRRLVR